MIMEMTLGNAIHEMLNNGGYITWSGSTGWDCSDDDECSSYMPTGEDYSATVQLSQGDTINITLEFDNTDASTSFCVENVDDAVDGIMDYINDEVGISEEVDGDTEVEYNND